MFAKLAAILPWYNKSSPWIFITNQNQFYNPNQESICMKCLSIWSGRKLK